MRYKSISIFQCILLLFVLSSCDEEVGKGTFAVEVTWGVDKPETPCWISADLRQVNEDGPPKVIASASPVLYNPSDGSDGGVPAIPYDAGDLASGGSGRVSLPFSAIPFGDDYVVVVTVKEDVYDDNTKVLYSGTSNRFSLNPEDMTRLKIVLSSVKVTIIGEEDGFINNPIVDLYLRINPEMFAEFLPETTVSLSNVENFDEGATTTVLLESLTPYKNGYIWPEWDMHKMAGCEGPCEDGKYTVYARYLSPPYDENGITAYNRTDVDVTPPILDEYPEFPDYTSEDFSFEINFNEGVHMFPDAINCDGLGTARVKLIDGEEQEDGRFIGDEFEATCPVDDTSENRKYTISVSTVDEAGHPSGTIVLGSTIVDTIPAEVDEVVRLEPRVVGLGQTVAIDFTITEPAEEFAVYFGLTHEITDDCSVDPSNELYISCRYQTSWDDEEGEIDVFLLLRDRAHNDSEMKLDDALFFDFTSPDVEDYGVTPEIAREGDEIMFEIDFTESPNEVEFDWDGLNVTNVSPSSRNPNTYRGSYIVSSSDENREYEFHVVAWDGAGNTSGTEYIGMVKIDTVAPFLEDDISVSQRVASVGDTFTFSFTVSEELEALTAFVGFVALDVNDACSRNGRSYTCAHTVRAEELEGPATIALGMQDWAGNVGSVIQPEAILYNFADPTIVSTIMMPEIANGQSTILIGISFSEMVNHVDFDWDNLPGVTDPDWDNYAANYFFPVEVEQSTPDGEYEIVLLSAEDTAGVGVGPESLGTITIDKTSPEVVDDALTVDNELLIEGDSVSIAFSVSEPLKFLTVRIDDVVVAGSYEGNCNGSSQCTFRHTAGGSESEGGKKIYVEMTDFAGNQSLAVFENMMVYDFTPPRVTASVITPEKATDGSEITVTVTFSEEVQPDTIVANWSGLAFSPFSGTASPNSFAATYSVQQTDAQGKYPFEIVQVMDMAGNPASGTIELGDGKIQRIIHVKWGQRSQEDGLSWDTAFSELSDGLKEAVTGNEIWVQQGTYRPRVLPEHNDPRQASFHLKSGVNVYGGFIGSEEELSDRQLQGENSFTILEGDLEGYGLDDPYVYHVVTANSRNHLDGFIIRNGAATGAIPDNVGGGILVEKGSINLENVVVYNNVATSSGGGIYSYMSTLEISSSAFYENEAGMEGGALYNTDSYIEIENCTFEGNFGDQNGGAIVNANTPSALIGNTIFRDNVADSGYGGAMKNQNSNLYLVNSIFDNNVARYGGGLADRSYSSVLISFCTFYGNEADVSGHGIYIEDNDATNIDITNSIVWYSDPAHNCQLETSKVDGDIELAYVDRPSCSGATNLTCDEGCFVDEDPQFKSVGTGIDAFQLDDNSPLIDEGSCALRPYDYMDLDDDWDYSERLPFDLDGEPRCVDEADLGAYEAQ